MDPSLFPKMLGLAGVASNETERARKFSRIMDGPMLAMAIWIIVEWYLEASGRLSISTVNSTDWIIWGFFLFETSIMTILVKKKRDYLLGNWINIVIIVLGFPVIWSELPTASALRVLRLVVLFDFLVQVSSTARRVLARNHLGTTLMIAFIIIVMAGFLIAVIDPAFDTPWDGIWWAWVTVTTVGYGDYVPVSIEGRLFASFLILMGIGIFSLLTANFSAFIISKEEREVLRREQRILSKLEDLDAKLMRLEKLISYNTRVLENNRPENSSENTESEDKKGKSSHDSDTK